MSENKDEKDIVLAQPISFSENCSKGWVCNATTKHDNRSDAANPCMCSSCITSKNVNYVVGPPVGSKCETYTSEKLKEMGFVGIYEPSSFNITCVVCGETLPWNKLGVELDILCEPEGGTEWVHVNCLSDDDQKKLRELDFSGDYILRSKERGTKEGA